jgi:hypothetical protein
MRWLLLVVAYLALVAAAVGSANILLEHILWGATILVVCSAIVAGVVDRGRRQATAVGFAVFSVAYMCALQLAPGKVPAIWFYRLAGYAVQVEQPSGYTRLLMDGPTGVTLPGGNQIARIIVSPVISVSVANALMTIVAGCVGGWIGAGAFKRRDEDALRAVDAGR